SSTEIWPPCSVPTTSTFVGFIFTVFSLQFLRTFNTPETFSLLPTSNGTHLPSAVISPYEVLGGPAGYGLESLAVFCAERHPESTRVPFHVVALVFGITPCAQRQPPRRAMDADITNLFIASSKNRFSPNKWISAYY